jgi:prepilin-type N-terminal cleavage/methylation domain-containing protein
MKKLKNSAFTLVELLVVISIIAILAGIAFPAFTKVKEQANQTKALSNAKSIGTFCKLYANDYKGDYPMYSNATTKAAAADSNAVFNDMFPTYFNDKGIFAVNGSAYCTNANSIGAVANVLGAAENDWALVTGLTDSSNARFPLIATGFTGAVGVYTNVEGVVGGVWKGQKAVVIRCDGSGAVEVCDKTNFTVPREDDPSKDIFTADPGVWFSASVVVLNPTP